MIRQQFLSTPAMIRDPGGHSWRRGARSAETRMRGTKLYTVPIRYILCCRVTVRRARARPRRVSDARRLRKVALSRSLSAVVITPSPCERRRSVSTRAGALHDAPLALDSPPLRRALDDLARRRRCARDAVGDVPGPPYAAAPAMSPEALGWRRRTH